jgi:endoglucanase
MMKNINTIRYILLFAVVHLLICAGDALCSGESTFHISKGVNISHWLSQSQRRGQQRQAYFTEKDVAYIAGLGYDHIRLPIDEEQMWDENGSKENEAFKLLHNAIKWSESQHLKVVADLHILRSHHFNADDKPLWTDPKAQEKFLLLWRDLSSELKQYSVGLVAYELMNEPVADDSEDWNNLVEKGIKEIRKQEPERKIVIGSNKWQSVSTFDQLRIPQGDRNIILSFHFYTPMLITHYKASWTEVGRYKGPVNYPGQIVAPRDIEELPLDIAEIVKGNNGVYNREILEKLLQKPLAAAKKYDLPLYCGEWGCLSTTPRKARLKWYSDVRHNLEKHNIAWANWDYKGGFGIVGRDGRANEEMIRTLIPE